MDGQTDVGHIHLIGGLVTCNPPKNRKFTVFAFRAQPIYKNRKFIVSGFRVHPIYKKMKFAVFVFRVHPIYQKSKFAVSVSRAHPIYEKMKFAVCKSGCKSDWLSILSKYGFPVPLNTL